MAGKALSPTVCNVINKGKVMKNAVVCLIALLLAVVANAQTHGYSTNFTFSQRNFADTIPIEVVDNQIFVKTTANGRVYRFCLDTGSSQGTVYANSTVIGLKALGSVVSRDAAGRSDTVGVVQLPPFTLGKLTITGYVASMFPSAMARTYDGIIGFDLFNKGLCCKIDTRNKRMIIADRRDFFDGEAGYAVHYKLKWFVPYVMVSPFKRHYDEALFDTGSNILYTMNKQRFDEHAYKSKNVNGQVEARVKGKLTIGNIGAERGGEVAFLKLDRLKWSDFSFVDVSAVTTQGSSRIGASILRYGSVIINGFRRYIRFQPYDEGDSVKVSNKPFTTAYVPTDDGKASVGVVMPGSADYEAGLRQGDVIVSIDGNAIATFAAFQQFPLVKGVAHKVRVRTQQGVIKDLVITR